MSESAFRGRPAQRPTMATRSEPILQWASNLQTKERQIYSGWLTEVGRDEHLDAVMKQAGYNQITIKHGNGNFVTHWAIPNACVIPIVEQVDTLGTIKAGPERHGMVLGWRETEDKKSQSFLKMFVFLVSLLEVGWETPFMLTAKSTLTDDVCGALLRHYDLIDFTEEARKKQGKPPAGYPFYSFALMLHPGAEVRRGSSVQKEFTPVENAMPDPPTANWAKEMYVGSNKHYMELVEGRLPEVVQWSIIASRPTAPQTENEQDNS